MSDREREFLEDIFSSIDISIMYRITPTTNPDSYSKACDTFRPRIGQSAATRTGLGCIAFVDLFKPCAMLNSLVTQFVPKGRPTSIQYGLGQARLSQSTRIHIANGNVVKPSHDAGAEFVLKVLSLVCNLGVNTLHALGFVSALRHSQSALRLAINTASFNLLARGQGGKLFEPHHIDHDVQEPIAPTVVREIRPVFDLAIGKCATVEHPKGVSSKPKGISFAFELTTLQWHPAQVLSSAIAQIRSFPLRSRLGVLFTHGVDGTRVQPEFFGCTSGQLVQIKASVPLTAKAKGVLLAIIAVIPYVVHRTSLLVEQAAQGFHSVTINKNNTVYINSFMLPKQILQRFALTLYLPAMNGGVSRGI